jgi:hypothetical protein
MQDMQLVFIILCPCSNVKSVSYSDEHLIHGQYTHNCMNSHIQQDCKSKLCMPPVNFKHVQLQNYRSAVVYIVSLVTPVILQNKQECTRYEFRQSWNVSFFIIIFFRPALWVSQARILRMPLLWSTSLHLVQEIALLIQYVESVTDILSPVPYQWGYAYNYYTLQTVTVCFTVS